MRRIDGLHLHAFALQPAAGQPRIGSAFGAMTVQDVDAKLGGEPGDLAGSPPVAETDMAGHGHARQPEHAIVGQTAERHRIALGAGIADDADLGPELGLAQRQIVDVAEQTPDRRAQAMQNTKRGAHWTPRLGTLDRSLVSFRRSVRERK